MSPSVELPPLDLLVGEQLSAVSFVMDYVEFHFDGHVVRALTNPIAHLPAGGVSFPGSGSRDALCAFIGAVVVAVTFEEGVSLHLSFAPRGELVVPLNAAAMRGPEALHWCPLGGPMQVVQ
jgi:hypothetical protein